MILNKVGGYNVAVQDAGGYADSGPRRGEGYARISTQSFRFTIEKDGQQHQVELVFDDLNNNFKLGKESTGFKPVVFE